MHDRRRWKDRIARLLMKTNSWFSALFLLAIGAGLLFQALPVLKQKGLASLLFSSSWKPFQGEFGFWPFLVGTFWVTGIAILIALPPSLLTSLYLSEYAASRTRRLFYPIIDLLSGIPPVIYGVWGTLALVPWISGTLAPHFVEFSTGYSVLAGGLVLSVMITPLIIGILTEIFKSIPQEMRDASLSLGATKWQTIKKMILLKSLPGIVAAVVLAVSRAFGETMAVLMVCGNVVQIPQSVFDPGYPLPALIANNYGEMLSLPHYQSALMFAALLLFVIILIFNTGSRLVLTRLENRYHL